MNVNELPEEVKDYIKSLETQWESKYKDLQISNKNLESHWELKYNELDERYQILLYKKFFRTSEQLDPDQLSLFCEKESSPIESDVEEESLMVKAHPRKKPGRKPIDEGLPREEIIIDIPEEDKKCACGDELTRIGEETKEQVQIIPPRIWVEKIIRPQYACKGCEGSGDEDKPAVRIAPAPPSIIPQSIAASSLLAFIFAGKYVDHMPFYRIEKGLERIGIHISRQNMSNWQQKVYIALIKLFDLMKKRLKTGSVMQMDETTVQVMKEAGRKDTQKSYMWLARGGPPDKPVVIYEYRETRAAKNIYDFLEGFSGYLQTDGYEGYSAALKGYPLITHVGCFAHARRKFFEASKVTKKPGSAQEGLKYIQKLYRIENTLREQKLRDDDFTAERIRQAEPLLKKFKEWLEKRVDQVPPSLELGKAISYTLSQWDKLTAFLDHPELTPDNNACENAIRPFVIGRKNWLFSGSPKGAESSCGIYSLIETAKQNGLNPLKYLHAVFDKAPLAKSQEDWEALLPWNLKDSLPG